MTLTLNSAIASKALALGFVLIPLIASAQTDPLGTEKDWREANEAVGRLQRGHNDVLKWEAANLPPTLKRQQAPLTPSNRTAGACRIKPELENCFHQPLLVLNGSHGCQPRSLSESENYEI